MVSDKLSQCPVYPSVEVFLACGAFADDSHITSYFSDGEGCQKMVRVESVYFFKGLRAYNAICFGFYYHLCQDCTGAYPGIDGKVKNGISHELILDIVATDFIPKVDLIELGYLIFQFGVFFKIGRKGGLIFMEVYLYPSIPLAVHIAGYAFVGSPPGSSGSFT